MPHSVSHHSCKLHDLCVEFVVSCGPDCFGVQLDVCVYQTACFVEVSDDCDDFERCWHLVSSHVSRIQPVQ